MQTHARKPTACEHGGLPVLEERRESRNGLWGSCDAARLDGGGVQATAARGLRSAIAG